MKLLITGANGFVGRALCADLIKQGLTVLAVVREKVKIDGCIPVEVGNINNSTDWKFALSDVDVVVHLAARVHVMHDTAIDPLDAFRKVNVEGTLNLALQAANAGVKRFVFLSSVKVNGEHTSLVNPFTELHTPNPQDSYGLSKLEAERGLLKIAQQTGMQVVIIRPPLIYGSGVKANFLSMMRIVRSGIPLPFGAINNKRSFVYIGNLISFIMCCIKHPAATNQVFLVSDGQDLSTTDLLKQIASAFGVKSRLLPLPQKLIELGAVMIGKRNITQRLCGSLRVDITKARDLLGWEPPFTVADGLIATAKGLTIYK